MQQGGDRGLRILIYLILARLVDPESFGIVALSAVFIELGQILLNQGLTAAIVQREDLVPGHLDSAFWGNMLFGLLLGGLVYGTAEGIAWIAREPDIAPIVRWFSLSFPIAALSGVQEAVLRRKLDFRALAIRSAVSQVVAGAAALTVAALGHGVWSLVVLELVRRAIAAVVLWTASDWRPGLEVSFRRYVELFEFGIHIMGVALVGFVRNRADFYLIGAFLGTVSLGYYSLARQLVNAVTRLVNGSVVEVMWPTYSRLQSEPERLARAIVRSTELLAIIAWPLYAGGIGLAAEFVPVVLGAKWEPIVPIVRAFLLGSIVMVITGSLLTAITAQGEARLRLGLEALVAVVTLMALALPYGIEAVAWAFAASVVLLMPVEARVAMRHLGLDRAEYRKRLTAPAVACLIMLIGIGVGIAALGDRWSSLATLAVLVPLGAAVYITALYAISPESLRRVVGDARIALRRSN
jgi:PST family polysaccharide transporter